MADSSAWERIVAFQQGVDERAVESVAPWAFGTALLSPSIPRVYDANYCRLEEAGGMPPEELADAATSTCEAAGLGHVSIVVFDEGEAARIRDGLLQLGFEAVRHVSMLLARPPKPSSAHVFQASLEQVEAVEGQIRADEDPDPPELTAALQEMNRRISATTPARWFATGGPDTAIAARAWLLELEGVAQVEDVATAPAQRGRGLARAIVSAAVRAAMDSGAELVFVVADADETTPELYLKLGFEPVGVTTRFVRKPPNGG